MSQLLYQVHLSIVSIGMTYDAVTFNTIINRLNIHEEFTTAKTDLCTPKQGCYCRDGQPLGKIY